MTEQILHDLKVPYYVFQNIHDWINGVNLGNGLAELMCHYMTNTQLNPEIFVKYANSQDADTSIKEIYNLLKYHHPGYFSSDRVQKYIFKLDKNGNIDVTDKNLLRIIEIRNAYVEAFNLLSEEKLGELTIEDAIANIVPQAATLIYSDDSFTVNELLDTTVMLKDDTREYTTSLLTTSLFGNIAKQMIQANFLKLSSRSEIQTNLLAKYFNRGDDEYLPGKNCRFYLDGKVQSNNYNPQLSKLNFAKPYSSINIARVKEFIRPDFPSLQEEKKERKLEYLAKRYTTMYIKDSETNMSLTPFKGLNKLGVSTNPKIIDPTMMPYDPDRGFSILGFKPLLQFYTIPKDMVNDSSNEILDSNYSGNVNLINKFIVTNRYFSNLMSTYRAYHQAVNQK